MSQLPEGQSDWFVRTVEATKSCAKGVKKCPCARRNGQREAGHFSCMQGQYLQSGAADRGREKLSRGSVYIPFQGKGRNILPEAGVVDPGPVTP